MFAYCNNNPVNLCDYNGAFSIAYCDPDCISPITLSCGKGAGSSKPWRKRIAVIYDNRFSGYCYGWVMSEGGFSHQANELIGRLSALNDVDALPYTTMDGFVKQWNSLSGAYNTVYVVGHGWAGGLSCAGQSISYEGDEYRFEELQDISAALICLYVCNGATMNGSGRSAASLIAGLSGSPVLAVQNGKLNFTWDGGFTKLENGGNWVIVYP